MLPVVSTPEEFDKLLWRNENFKEAALDIFTRMDKQITEVSFPSNGSMPVVITKGEIVKFFPQIFEDAFVNETKALSFLNANNVIVPKLITSGKVGSWHYVLMSRLLGNSLKDVWPNLTLEKKKSAC